MNTEEYLEDSDSSDDDYVPDSKVEDAVSEVESDGDPEDQLSGSDDESSKGRKRTKRVKKVKKKSKVIEDKDTPDTATTESNNVEDQKKKADDLWADFMKDTGFKSKSSQSISVNSQNNVEQSSSKSAVDKKKDETAKKLPSSKVKITQIFEFAGEEVTVEKEVDANSAEAGLLTKSSSKVHEPKKTTGGLSGIGNVLSQLGKKQKISTLEKTKLDWDRFKRDECIEEELQAYNKGKDGYLERQDFLQRADLRRFEIEKDIRNVERAKRFNSAL